MLIKNHLSQKNTRINLYQPELLDSNCNRICMPLVHTGIQEEVHSGLVGEDQIKCHPHSFDGQKALFQRENYGLFMLNNRKHILPWCRCSTWKLVYIYNYINGYILSQSIDVLRVFWSR